MIEEIQALKRQTQHLYEEARDGDLDRGLVAVLVQLVNLQVRIVQVESEVVKQELLSARIEALESQAGRRWQAA